MPYATVVPISLGASFTGLTLYWTLVDAAGAVDSVLKDQTTGFSEQGSGSYLLHVAQVEDDFLGAIVVHDTPLGAATAFPLAGVTVFGNHPLHPRNFDPSVHTVDGTRTWNRMMKALTSCVFGTSTESGAQITYQDLDAQDDITVTVAASGAERTSSNLL